MRFAPKLSVGVRLTLAMILVVVVSGGLGAVLGYQAMRLNLLRPPHRGREGQETRSDNRSSPPPQERPSSTQAPVPGPQDGPPQPHGLRHPPRLFNRMFLINLGVGVIVSLAAGIWLSRRFSRPLALLAEGAGVLGSGDLDHRVPLTGDDEFGRVANSMNQMAERIGDQIDALRADGRRRQQLLADVAHELRSPVATLRTMAEALRDGIAAGPERSERVWSAW
jgi:signal transduction histidine kinase